MASKFGQKRGDLVFAKSLDEPILGLTTGLANLIMIKDRNDIKQDYPKNFIPSPR